MIKIKLNRCMASPNIAEEMTVTHQPILNELQRAGCKKVYVWVPFDLIQKTSGPNQSLRKTAEMKLTRPRFEADCAWRQNMDRIRQYQGKTVVVKGESSQTVTKPGLTTRKVLLCVWWVCTGVICYELLLYDQPPRYTNY